MIDAAAVLSHLEELRALTADENGAQRLAWTPNWLRARAWFEQKLAGQAPPAPLCPSLISPSSITTTPPATTGSPCPEDLTAPS